MATPVSSAFNKALIAPRRDVTMRVTALAQNGSNLEPIRVIDEVVEGTIYVDTERSTRRTAQLRIVNKNGEFTPTSPDYASVGTNALFWWDKLFKIEYGVKIGSAYEYIPLGIFMVDTTEVLAERGVSILNIDGSDLWKKFTFSTFALPKAYAKHTYYNTIISDFATNAGVTRVNLGTYSDRDDAEQKIQAPLYFEIDDNRGEELQTLCNNWGIEIYFDVDGYLTTRCKHCLAIEIANNPPVWTFDTGEEAVMLSITKRKSGDTIFNHVVVTGETDDGNAVVAAETIDGIGTTVTGKRYLNDASSPTRVEIIGDRVKRIKSTTIRTTAAAQYVADAEMQIGSSIEEEITLPTVTIPQFEGNDVIAINESLSKTNDRFFLKRFDIPMRDSKQDIKVSKVRPI